MNSGKIIKLISNDYSVLSNDCVYICKSRGNFRYHDIKPLVGDEVYFDKENELITQVMNRKNELFRPPISNVDQALVVTNVYPSFSSNLLDKMLSCLLYTYPIPLDRG